MTLSYALILALLVAATQPEIVVRGQVLTLGHGYLVFTTGDALSLDPDAQIAPHLRLGTSVRVHVDALTHHVRAVESAAGATAAGDIDAAKLPRDFVAVSPGSARTNQAGNAGAYAHIVTVSIDVTVPSDTPPTADVYLSTDRSSYSAAELRMNRVDAYHWTVTLPLVEGTTLHYQFTRGDYAGVERDRSGSVIVPRSLDVHADVHSNDTVARWADIS